MLRRKRDLLVWFTIQASLVKLVDISVQVSISTMAADSHHQTCAACAQPLRLDQFPSKPVDSKCTHEMETCSPCWKQWLQVQVASKTFDKIQCAQCTGMLTQSEVKALASQEVYQRYVRSSVLQLDL
jgi:hypothetical protein